MPPSPGEAVGIAGHQATLGPFSPTLKRELHERVPQAGTGRDSC